MRVTVLNLVSSCTFVHDSSLLRLSPLFCFYIVFRYKKWERLCSTSCPLARSCMTLPCCASLPCFVSFLFLDIKKWELQGSNLWPSACKADALPAELNSHVFNDSIITQKLTRKGVEPLIRPWEGRVLTAWPTGQRRKIAEEGFEPPTLRVWTACSSQLSYSASSRLVYYIVILSVCQYLFSKNCLFLKTFIVPGWCTGFHCSWPAPVFL